MIKQTILSLFLTGGMALVFAAGKEEPQSQWDGKSTITIHGDHTLSSAARAIDKPEVFQYDEQQRRAVCRMDLHIRGTLTLENETLAISEREKGNTITILPKGKLLLKQSTLCSADRSKYDIMSSGYVEALHSRILDYGNLSYRCFRLEKTSITLLRHSALCGRNIYITSPQAVVEIENCDFTGSRQNFRLTKDVQVALTDCKSIITSSLAPGSRIFVKRSVEITLLDREGKGIPGAEIEAVSRNRAGVESKSGLVRTAVDGKALIPLVYVDFDSNGGNSFYRSHITAMVGDQSYTLQEKWRPSEKILIMKQDGENFVEYE